MAKQFKIQLCEENTKASIEYNEKIQNDLKQSSFSNEEAIQNQSVKDVKFVKSFPARNEPLNVKKTDRMKEFQCNLCRKTFTRSSFLHRHIKTSHDSIKPFQCKTCYKSYNLKGTLKIHMKTVHEDVKATHKCSFCSKNFVQKKSLNIHIKTIRGQA